MKELHTLVDFENVKPTLEELANLAPGFTNVWLFHGPNEQKRAEQIRLADSRVTLVPHAGKGKNALDLSFYLGYVAYRHPEAHLVVVANDKGYDPMIAHARLLKFTVRRVGYKTKPAAKRMPIPTDQEPATTVKAAWANSTVSANAPTRSKVAGKRVPSKKAVAQQTPAKRAATSNPAPATAHAKPAAPVTAVAAEAKAFARIKKAVSNMGNERPTKTKSFLRHIGAMLGQGSKAEQIEAVVAKLEKEGVVRITGEAVEYLH